MPKWILRLGRVTQKSSGLVDLLLLQQSTEKLAVSHGLKITQNVAFECFEFWHFPPIFVLSKLSCLVTLFDRKF